MSAVEPPFHTVSNREVWLEIQEMKALLMSVVSKLENQEEHHRSHAEVLADHESRLRGLDLKFYGILGGGIAAIGGMFVALVQGAFV